MLRLAHIIIGKISGGAVIGGGARRFHIGAGFVFVAPHGDARTLTRQQGEGLHGFACAIVTKESAMRMFDNRDARLGARLLPGISSLPYLQTETKAQESSRLQLARQCKSVVACHLDAVRRQIGYRSQMVWSRISQPTRPASGMARRRTRTEGSSTLHREQHVKWNPQQ